MDELSVKCLLHANDQVILVPSACGLQEMVNKMNDFVKKKSVKVYVGKTKVMVFERGESTTECDLIIENEKVEQVKEFIYLCSRLQIIANMAEISKKRMNADNKVNGA
ncbi:hypothetical protein EVAR_61109_1 [Eumeta japonica]|uniref:Reverse transcriptase domain-containing protein n=1 Tax=Eumeta variegata TaxID=151549 RepID=A0A4C1YRQ7_EUMVA|nr:hypothetical protein EVAR_61109_1 [Eumeta japonica]